MLEGINNDDPIHHFVENLETQGDQDHSKKLLTLDRLERVQNRLKNLGKAGSKVFDWGINVGIAVTALTMSVQSLLFNNPDWVSSPVTEYMDENDIPIELVEGLDLEGLRVYDENDLPAAFHASGFYNYKDAMSKVLKDNACFMRGEAYSMIVMSPERSAAEHVNLYTAIPIEDIHVDENMAEIYRAWTLLHEVGHFVDKGVGHDQNINFKEARGRSDEEHTLSREIFADQFALERVGEISADLEQHVIYLRAQNAIMSYDNTHASAVYLDAMRSDDGRDVPTLEGVEQKFELLRDAIVKSYVNIYARNGLNVPGSDDYAYHYYMGALDLREQDETVQDLPQSTQRALDLYIESFEYFAPEKAIELQNKMDEINRPIVPFGFPGH